MAILPAGEARRYYQAKVLRRRIYVVCAALVLLGVLGFEVKGLIARSKADVKPAAVAAAAPPRSFAAKQVIDVNTVASAIGQFVLANGALPTSLYTTAGNQIVLCGSYCNAALYAVGGFGAYQASGVQITQYKLNLRAPDAATMYLVPGAKCGKGGALGDRNSAKNAMAILYTVSTGTTTEPRCIVL